MAYAQNILRRTGWLLLVAVLVALQTWGPYLASNLFLHQSHWWRVGAVRTIMFDSATYLSWLGYVREGIPFANNLGWFRNILAVLWKILPLDTTTAEVWLLSRWLVAVLTVLVVYAICLRLFRVSKKSALTLTVSFSALVIAHAGLRPGVYSWYLPFGLIACAIAWYLQSTTQKLSFIQKLALSVLALFCASIYPWFLIPVSLWLAVFWWQDILRHIHIRSFSLLLGLACLLLGSLGLVTLPHLLTTPAAHIQLETFARYGLGFTHLPFVSTLVFVVMGWLIAILWYARHKPNTAHALIAPFTSWLIALFSLELTPFTGIVFQNDHFRAFIMILSWFSLVFFVAHTETQTSSAQHAKRLHALTPIIIFCLSIFFLISKTIPLIKNPSDDLLPIHLAYWLPLAITCFVFLTKNKTCALLSLLFFSGIIGGIASVDVIRREIQPDSELRHRAAISQLILQETRQTDTICTDPKNADRFAANTPRRIIPATTYRFLPESDASQLDVIKTLATSYDFNRADQLETFHHLVEQDRFLPCQENAWFVALASRLSIPTSTAHAIAGCPKEQLDRQWEEILQISHTSSTSTSVSLQTICPWLLIPNDQRPFWHIPPSMKQFITEDVSLIHVAP